MKYMVLIYSDETKESELSQDEWQALLQEHNDFATKYGEQVIAGEPLEPTPTAKTLRRQNGSFTTLDGPFAETKEQLGGYYVLEVGTMEEAVDMAKDLPLAEYSAIEIRPVMQL